MLYNQIRTFINNIMTDKKTVEEEINIDTRDGEAMI